MRLIDLLEDERADMHRLTDIEITGLTADSRAVEPGYLFAAFPGAMTDGRRFIDDAIGRGAAAVLAPIGTDLNQDSVQLVTDSNPRQRFAKMAARFFGHQPETVVAVTGTNGKTSVSQFVHQIWTHAGRTSAAFGTLGVVSKSGSTAGTLTTPDPVSLHETLAQLDDQGIDNVAMEASSHGLDQYRLDGVKVCAAGFTNLSRDHLDYHGSMDNYFAAKLRLFTDVLSSGGVAVVNADSSESDAIIAACSLKGHRVITFGNKGDTLGLQSSRPGAGGQDLQLIVNGKAERMFLPLVGHFQAMNALCAAGLAMATGVDTDVVLDALSNLKSVPGRMDYVGSRQNGASVYVDYAHTPAALATALEALRPHTENQLAIVFGAGGDRDQGKREPMGRAATAADRIYVTDDNPRTESPEHIRAAVLKGCPDAIEIGDRARAVDQAVKSLTGGDVLLIAGKGHETGQIVGTKTLPFDDREVAQQSLIIADQNE